MRFTVATALVSALAVAAQTNHTIIVGGNGTLTYNPSNITATPGDIISFQFVAKNHTATQSTFAAPCTQLDNTTVTPSIIGISSGFMPVDANATSFPTWSFQVTDTTPLWFFCLQANHCQQGMVFSINATPQKSFDTFQAAAKATTNSTAAPETDGSQTPVGGSGSSGSNVTSSTPSIASPNGSPISSTATNSGAATTPTSGAMSIRRSDALIASFLAVALGISL